MRAALYARISEDRTGEAIGVADQLKRARKLVKERGGTVAGEYPDNDLSALKAGPRPSYRQLMSDVDAGKITHIVVFHLSRLWRNRRERADGIEALRAARVSVVTVQGPELDLTTAAGRAVAGLIGEFDTFESEIKSERIVAAAQRRAEAGGYHGGLRPFGFGPIVGEDDRTGKPIRDPYQLVPGEAAEIKRAAGQILAGVPLGKVVRDLNDRGVRTVRGKPWATGTVRDMLMSPRIAGLSEYRGTIVGPARWPAIVTEADHHALVSLFRDPKRKTTTGNRASYLLSGIAVCAVCQGSITASGQKRSTPGGRARHIYRCRVGFCVGRRRDWCDAYVEERLFERLAQPDAADLLVDHDQPDFEALRTEAHSIRIRLDGAAASFARNLIDQRQLEIISSEGQKRLAEIAAAQAHTSRAPVLRPLVEAAEAAGNDYDARIEAVEARWDTMSLDRQRATVQVLVTVKLHPGGGGRRTFDETKVEIIPKG